MIKGYKLARGESSKTLAKIELSPAAQEATTREINAYIEKCYEQQKLEPEDISSNPEEVHDRLLARLCGAMVESFKDMHVTLGGASVSIYFLPFSKQWIQVMRQSTRSPYRIEPLEVSSTAADFLKQIVERLKGEAEDE